MIVHQEKETSVDNKKTTVYEKVESLHLGLAIQSQVVSSIKSQMLGMTIGEYLTAHGLIA